jgi:hypothetical protein
VRASNVVRGSLGLLVQHLDLMRAWRRDVARVGPLTPRQWPIGPHYAHRYPGETGWTYFKLAAAEWYLTTLRDMDKVLPELDRFMGVEMALDGCLSSAGSSVDAAVMRLIRSLARRHERDGTTIPPGLARLMFKSDWGLVVEPLARLSPAITLASGPVAHRELVSSTRSLITARQLLDERTLLEAGPPTSTSQARLKEITKVLAGLDIGPVAELRWLRNRSTHEDTLVRRFIRGGAAEATCLLRTPRGDFEAPVLFLRGRVDACRRLVDEILADADAVDGTSRENTT